ncbi:aldolase/citrate lyase family protein [Neisseria leonii]|uniref:HpcH/HpaI aldolase/citrate lyase family protein n=1 Tax=Neisseria leonii TaxID=2995413 RepID=UPI0030D25B15
MMGKIQPVSYLFVPGMRTDRIAKALAAGADVVVMDWEDAVAEADKAAARTLLADYFAAGGAPVWLRINAAGSVHYAADVAALRTLPDIIGVLLPKTESAAQVEDLVRACGRPVLAVLETAQGVCALGGIAGARGLYALSYGCLDLCHQLGIRTGSAAAADFFRRIGFDLLLHSQANGLAAPVATIFPDFRDEAGLADYAAYAADAGFGGMLCIHPNQLPTVHRAWQPDAAALAEAAQIVAQADAGGEAVFAVNGRMADKPLIEQSRRLLERAKRYGGAA